MTDALYVGATGMRAAQTQVDTIANNVANVNTVGFRRETVNFSSVMAALQSGATDPLGQTLRESLQTRGAGAIASLQLSTNGGELKQTQAPLDVAIEGRGFFEVQMPDGTPAYTRAGALSLNSEGMLSGAGLPLSARINVPSDASELRITPDGRVLANFADRSDVELGNIELAAFANPAGLESIGDNLYRPTDASGSMQLGAPGEIGNGTLRQGYLESSNVQLVDELVSLMLAQRGFEMNSKIVQAADQMLGITNALYRS
ncbi:MAG TPA: flagellar basal-body rod protein FlgG [Steroidobacteraceae bacterium]|jgi:flagellar basal-body rod protein FlgG|nr:flagellar basal-body rod protein FlgG [Steroidobacteraceae bacterium]